MSRVFSKTPQPQKSKQSPANPRSVDPCPSVEAIISFSTYWRTYFFRREQTVSSTNLQLSIFSPSILTLSCAHENRCDRWLDACCMDRAKLISYINYRADTEHTMLLLQVVGLTLGICSHAQTLVGKRRFPSAAPSIWQPIAMCSIRSSLVRSTLFHKGTSKDRAIGPPTLAACQYLDISVL